MTMTMTTVRRPCPCLRYKNVDVNIMTIIYGDNGFCIQIIEHNTTKKKTVTRGLRCHCQIYTLLIEDNRSQS